MARVLIRSYPDDIHAFEVALALADLGHEAQIWHGGDFPTRQTASVRFSPDGPRWEAAGPELDLRSSEPFDTVWNRRPTPPALPTDLHPADLPVARRECGDFVEGLARLVAPEAFWVNPLETRQRSNLKTVQLAEAKRAGMSIPPTLLSNDPTEIRAFLREQKDCVYKAFYPAQWEHGQDVAYLLTTGVREEDLPDDEMLRLTPGIFQRKVEKAYEVRVNFLGGHCVAAKLRSQDSDLTELDWRASAAALKIEPVQLSPAVADGCRRLMAELGLVFGCIDLIVTPKGETVFLEVNPMGQFLWVEDGCPQIPLLDLFCDFLVTGSADYQPKSRPGPLRHRDYYDRAMARLESTKHLHVTDSVETFVSKDDASSFGAEPSGDSPTGGVTRPKEHAVEEE